MTIDKNKLEKWMKDSHKPLTKKQIKRIKQEDKGLRKPPSEIEWEYWQSGFNMGFNQCLQLLFFQVHKGALNNDTNK